MDFDDIVVKESPGLCRCCLSEGCYKELGSEYSWMNETEVYADMLLECFDISISQHMEGPNGPNRLICEVCITRLRDACNFKKQVLDSEKKFVDMVGRGEFRPKVVIYQQDMKAENLEVIDDSAIDYLDNDIQYEQNDESMRPEEPHTSGNITAITLPTKARRGRPRKNPDVKIEKKAKKKTVNRGELKGGQESSAKPRKSVLSDEDHMLSKPAVSVKDKLKITRNNIIQVLINSNVMPFRWLKSSYRCFYCYDIFQEASDLKNHQMAHPGDEIKVQTMNKYWEPVVYVDISNISCKLCTQPVTDLYDLIDHLIAKHGVDYNKDVGSSMVCFKLENLNVACLVCGANFYTFGPLLHHTNKDHKGTSAILCDVCGQHFKDNHLLKTHIKLVHENSGVLCPDCGEKFETRTKLRTHQKNQHNMDYKFKCLVCPQVFQSHYKRSRHMAEEHKTRRKIKCLHCPKTFVFRSMMMNHVRDMHLKVRDHVCSVCGFKAFNNTRLKMHMYKHSGEKNFKCEACDKAFSTRKIMRAHFLRMHKNVEPMMHYQDPYVGQVQNV